MNKLLSTTIFILFIFPSIGFAQFSRYVIQLTDKAGTPFTTSDPIKFLSQRAIDRRTRYNISINESDLPCTPAYIDSIQLAGNVTILNVSKWLNQVCILTTDAAALDKINGFSFVQTTHPVALRNRSGRRTADKFPLPSANKPVPAPVAKPQNPADFYDYGLAYPQVHMHHTEFLHNLGFKGQGMQLAIMDAGFYHYQSLPTFDSIRTGKQILGTWDFVANESSVDEDNSHGMNCFSTIAANLPGSFVGTSPKSSYYLFRTEDAGSEYPVEEQNYAAAAERADSLGVDVFSVSLGYNTFDDPAFDLNYADLDGNTTAITKACDFAASKGILIAVAVGNDGSSTWHYLTAPADADSVLAVGAVNASRQVAPFSSYGPSADGQVKPDVAAIGQGAVVANLSTGGPSYNNGTSFACPIMAGVATCLWQAFPELNNMSVITALRESGDRSQTPDDRTGYGIPDVKKAFVSILKKQYAQQVTLSNNCKTNIAWTVKCAQGMRMIIERKLPADQNYLPVGTQNFTGSFSAKGFVFEDDLSALAAGIVVSYRLKMVIGTDTSFYFDAATVNYVQNCGTVTEKITIGPNPVNDNLTILVARNNPAKLSVVMHAVSGQAVYQVSQQANGVQTITVPMKRLSRGIYYVTVYLDDKKEMVKKIVKE